MSWVGEAADFSLEKSLPQVSLNCVVFLCIFGRCLEDVQCTMYIYYTCTFMKLIFSEKTLCNA